MFVVTVGDAVYVYRHSLLGLPEENLQWMPSNALDLPTAVGGNSQPTVLLWFRCNDTWVLYPWLPQLWWTRLLVVCHSLSIGTRAEAFAHARTTGHVLIWWLQSWVAFCSHTPKEEPMRTAHHDLAAGGVLPCPVPAHGGRTDGRREQWAMADPHRSVSTTGQHGAASLAVGAVRGPLDPGQDWTQHNKYWTQS